MSDSEASQTGNSGPTSPTEVLRWWQKPWPLLLWLTLPLYALDQLTKFAVLASLPHYASIPVIPGFFNLVHVYNTGAAFGLGKDNNWFFLLLAAGALVFISILWWRGVFLFFSTRLAVSLLLAGVAGNLTDRILHGHVVDFLDFILPWYGHWPAFNVADSCICVAAFILVWSAIFPPRDPTPAQPSPKTSHS
jgi:signal peptidase II